MSNNLKQLFLCAVVGYVVNDFFKSFVATETYCAFLSFTHFDFAWCLGFGNYLP